MSPTAEPADKFKELIVYIARRLPPEAALGRVKLAKLLMKCDFEAYAYLGSPMTGATYEPKVIAGLKRELESLRGCLEQLEGAVDD